MKYKYLLFDPYLWMLLLINIILLYKYEQTPQLFTTLIWLYWSQSVVYGFFNFLDMLTISRANSLAIDTEQGLKPNNGGLSISSGWVFLLHYGFFHFVYFIFLFSLKKTGQFEWGFFKMYLLLFIIIQLINFIQHKIQNRKRFVNISAMFFIPYFRVIPMHLCILLPAFFNWSNLTVFLVLKIICDILMYIVTKGFIWKNSLIATVERKNLIATKTSE